MFYYLINFTSREKELARASETDVSAMYTDFSKSN